MAKRKVRKVKIYDPITGKYKIVNETPEIKRQIEERQKKIRQEETRKRQENKIKAQTKKLSELKRLNPGQYEEYIVTSKGNIEKSNKWYDKRIKQLERNFAKAKDKAKAKERLVTGRKEANKRYSLQKIREKDNSRGIQAIRDLNYFGTEFNAILQSIPDELYQLYDSIIAILGGKSINSSYNLEDFYSENYREIMLPNMIKEINTIIGKIKLALSVITDFKSKYKKDSYIQAECNKLIYKLNRLIEECLNCETYKNYKTNFSTTETEPKYKNDLYLSGL